jgi:hypothetical protein
MDINTRLDAYYTKVITQKLGVETPLMAIPSRSRGANNHITHRLLATLASLAHHDPHRASFQQRLTDAVNLRANGSLEKGVHR